VPRVADEIAAFVCSGVAVIVATRDADLRPQAARAWGPEIYADGAAIALCVGAAADSPTRANLEVGGPIAAVFSLPTSYRTVQIKGDVLELADPTPQQLARVEEHFDAFARETAQVGLPPERARRLLDSSFVAVRFSARELYDQTPGPNAGARL
jgi:hypothetical protein